MRWCPLVLGNRSVELICFCEHYSTNGLLSWFIDYECFGCYGEFHGSVNLFLEANWSDDMDQPNRLYN